MIYHCVRPLCRISTYFVKEHLQMDEVKIDIVDLSRHKVKCALANIS